ncbi:sensor domain-containing diguanylate cyclase [Rhizobium mesosinicum]|uniref:diguanylate cyclase n=1 Tax=Rhizobium mesosinicum TaxID=335017 RepID=A0ABS7GT36_9HYPH|nr:GGDEF domain-containing protein [Rhizobium mesosinicum]MBW9052967.1 GGDEF domain-containing protein [Rhizobium mesosinicum]
MNRITLEGKLLFATVIVAFLTLVLTASALIPTYESYRSTQDNLLAIERFRQVLEAATRMSAERGPANDILAIEPGSDLLAIERLTTFRRISDLALEALDEPIAVEIFCPLPDLQKALADTRDQLRKARETVDRIAATPLAERRPEGVQAAIGEMIEVIETFQAVVDWHVAAFTSGRPELTAPFLTGRMISDMREYGGRAASQIMGPIATRQPLRDSNVTDASLTIGRLLELRTLMQGQKVITDHDALSADLMKDVDTIFFGSGLDLVMILIEQGKISGDYSVSAVDLTRDYVPTLRPLERLRTLFLDDVVKRYRTQHDAASYRLSVIAVITASALAVLFMLFRSIRLHMLDPLLTARRQIIALAEGSGMTDLETISKAPEMRSLFEALELLRGKLDERAEYEARLKTQAEKDGLTGVWNRRALEGFGNVPSEREEDICLMLIDIDHFKAVNDTYGHLTGDKVLVEIAALLQSAMRPTDIVARYGGEEFAVLVSTSDLSNTVDFAEELRGRIQAHIIRDAETGIDISITVSIGIASSPCGADGWRQLIASADEALYCAKKKGRNRTCVFGDEADRDIVASALIPFRARRSASL